MTDKTLLTVLGVVYLWMGLMVATAWIGLMVYDDEPMSVDRALVIYAVAIISWPLVMIALASEK